MSAYCYLLSNGNGRTYVGATTDVTKRLRQHNQELAGGARATSISVSQGHLWKRICYISNIPEWKSALQIEWRWKQLGRTQYKHIKNPIERRLYALKKLLSLDRWYRDFIKRESQFMVPINFEYINTGDYHTEGSIGAGGNIHCLSKQIFK
jgi:structure-specific endonuclease subunit SLX1